MLSTDEFKAFAANVVLFLHNTSLVEDEPYPNLLREKGGNGFPTMSFMDHTGRLLTQQPFRELTVPKLQEKFAALQHWRALKAEAANGDAKLAKRVFALELGFGMLSFEEARAGLKKVRGSLSEAERKGYESKLVDLEFGDQLRRIDFRDEATLLAAGKHFLAMIEKDRIPRTRQITTFWQGALAYAESKKDADLFEKVMKRAQKEMGDDPRAKRYIRSVERRLARLRRGSGR